MSQNPLRVAVIGAGLRARQAISPALAGLPQLRLEAVWEIDHAKRLDVMQAYHIPMGYGERGVLDYQRMMEEVRPDAIFAIGQPHVFYDLWAWILDRSIPLMIEKPLALTLHQAHSLEYIARQKNVTTQVAFQRRYSPLATNALAACRTRGTLNHAVCRFYKCQPEPNLGARDHMMDDTVHSVDTLRWMCGGNITGIESHTKRIGTPDINFISATLHFDNGSTGFLINSWTSGKRIFEVEMHAPGIYAQIEHELGGHIYQDGNLKGQYISAQEAAGSERFEVYTGVEAAILDFVQAIQTGQSAMSCFSDAIHTMKACETILAQSLMREN